MITATSEQYWAGIPGITIVDDDPEERESLKDVLQREGLKTHVVTTSYGNDLPALVKEIKEVGFPVICDLRLGVKGPFLTRSGAEVVASLYDSKFPALLATMFSEIDDIGLHPFLRKVPVVIPKDILGERSQIEQGIKLCQDEFLGRFAAQRRPHRSLVEIREVLPNQGPTKDPRILAIVPGWNQKRVVELPWASIPTDIRPQVSPGVRLIADINVGASRAQDLYFENVKVAKPIRDDDGLA